MKKKIIIVITLLLCVILLSIGYVKLSNPTDNENRDVSNSESSKIFFGLNDVVKHDNLCEMSDLYAEVLDDAAKAEGWYYYYTNDNDSPAEVIKWEASGENYTTVEVLFKIKNISGKAQTFGKKVVARMLYQKDANSEIETYDGTVFQQNPGQVEKSGEIIMWSTNPVEIDDDESTNVSFRFDIPKDTYEKIYSTLVREDTGATATCEFSFGDGKTYVIDLMQTLILASQYES